MFDLFVGGIGQGKTYCMVAMAYEAPKDEFKNVFANLDLMIPGKNCVKWRNFEQIADANCGVLLIDEADMWINSRKFATLDDTARDVLKEHRKHHIRIVATTQHVTFIDKVFRILCDRVCLVRRYSIPLLGLFYPDSIRPSVICKNCGKVRMDDGIGDRFYWWQRWLFFGTFYAWKIYPPTILGEDESANANDVQEKEIPSIGWGWKQFNSHIAAMYDTSARASVDAKEWREEKLGIKRGFDFSSKGL